MNISEDDNALELPLSISVTPYFRISDSRVNEIIGQIQHSVSYWKKTAVKYNLSRAEQEGMESAFVLKNKL